MYPDNSTNNQEEDFRRISKARIFDGHPFRPGIYAVSVMVPVYVSIIVVISVLFSYLHNKEYTLVFFSLLPGALLGFVILVMERLLGQLKNYMFPQMGKLLTAFLLFFMHIICYLASSSIVVSYPVGLLMEKANQMSGLAGEYSLFTANFFIVAGIISWLRNARSSPNPCF
jgi:hypothetical protein